jgi:hypothetical protein
LLRHKTHLSQAILKAGERREERLGDNLLDEMRRLQQKAWELLARTESEGDHRGAIVALREVRECLESLGEMLAKVPSSGGDGERKKMVIRFVGPGDKPERDKP